MKLLNSACNIFRNFLHSAVLLFVITTGIFSQTVRQTRAIWISTNYKLDWPGNFSEPERQKQELVSILSDVRNRNFNTVFFQVRSGGSVLFNSSLEPKSSYVLLNADSSFVFDPLKFAIQQAHKKQLELYAWVNVFNITPDIRDDASQLNNHLMNLHPNWIIEDKSEKTTRYWLDPGLPEVRNYLVNLISELASGYNIDGIVLDYMRYPSKKFNDDFSYTIYGYGKNRSDWRRENINLFLDSLYTKIKERNKFIKIGVAPLGVYENKNNQFLSAKDDVYQDALYYMKRKIVDFLAPQVYWKINFSPSFRNTAKFWIDHSYGRNVLISIGAYKPEVRRELLTQIKTAGRLGADGIAVYRYSNIKNNPKVRFKNFVFPQEMKWIDDFSPQAPRQLKAKIIDIEPLTIVFTWKNKDNPHSIALYRLEDNAHELIAIIPGNRKSIKIGIQNAEKEKYVFAIKALSRLKNESSFSNKVEVKLKQRN